MDGLQPMEQVEAIVSAKAFEAIVWSLKMKCDETVSGQEQGGGAIGQQ